MLPRPITFRRLVHRLSRSRKQLQPPWPYRLRQSASPSNPTFGRSKQRLLPGLSRIRLLCPTACLNRRQRATHSAKKEAARSRNCPLASHTPCCEASPPSLAHKGTCVHLQALLPSARQCLTPRLLTRRVPPGRADRNGTSQQSPDLSTLPPPKQEARWHQGRAPGTTAQLQTRHETKVGNGKAIAGKRKAGAAATASQPKKAARGSLHAFLTPK